MAVLQVRHQAAPSEDFFPEGSHGRLCDIALEPLREWRERIGRFENRSCRMLAALNMVSEFWA